VAPTLVLCVSYGAAWLIGVLSWNFESDLLINLMITIVIDSIFATFEEIGCRGGVSWSVCQREASSRASS
jgi:hypothetical protein